MYSQQKIKDILIHKDVLVREALGVLNQTGQQILLIEDNDSALAGIITDGDIRRFIMENEKIDVPVSQAMNTSFKFLTEKERDQAIPILKKKKINHIPIVDERRRVVDLITALDFIKSKEKQVDIPVVIMAGGKGKRLSPLTKIIPKPLIPVGGKTMIEVIMESFRRYGFHNFTVIVNYKKELIKSYFNENGASNGVKFVDETEFLGTAGGLRMLRNIIGETFILTNCDITVNFDLMDMFQFHKISNADLTVLGVKKKIDVPYGVIQLTDDHSVESIQEKPHYYFNIISGIYILQSSLLEMIPESRAYGMDELISSCLSDKKRVTCYLIENGWFDIGQFEEYKVLLKKMGILDVA